MYTILCSSWIIFLKQIQVLTFSVCPEVTTLPSLTHSKEHGVSHLAEQVTLNGWFSLIEGVSLSGTNFGTTVLSPLPVWKGYGKLNIK